MNLSDAMEMMKRNFELLWNARLPVSGRPAAPLDPVNGCPIEVCRVPAHLLPVHEGYRDDGTVMANNGRYVIFLSDSPAPAPARLSALTGQWLERYYELHEYGHVKEGDVFEDDPAKVFDRFVTPFFEWAPIELKADAWAAHLLLVEARNAGNAALVSQLEAEIVQRGFPNPMQ